MIDVITSIFSKLTTPEVKFIRTLEGILVVVFNLVLGIATLLVNLLTTNSHLLPPVTVAKILVVINGVAVIVRTALKAVLAIQAQTPQVQVPYVAQGITSGSSNVASGGITSYTTSGLVSSNPQEELDLYLEEQDAKQNMPGTPAEEVKHGLSPTPPPAPAAKRRPAAPRAKK